MPARKNIRCYDYINHPYDQVKKVITDDPLTIFQDSTRSAADRATDVAASLHVNIGGVDLGKDVNIVVKNIEELEKRVGEPVKTVIDFEWKAVSNPGLFPLLHGQLQVYPLTSTETQLDLSGNYDVPLGIVGSAIDAVIGHKIAEASVLRFIKDVAAHLRHNLK